jgi:RHS repeat-associated protein
MKTLLCHLASVVFGFSLLLLAGPFARATIFVEATSSFSGVTIDPTSGSVEYLAALQSSAYAQAGANAQYDSIDPSTATITDVPVPGGLATGTGSASASSLTGSSGATGFVPGTTAGFDTSAGRASINGEFEIIGASGAVNVTFSTVISGELNLSSDAYGVSGQGETDFALSVDGNPVLFNDQILTIGPDQTQSGTVSETLTASMTLTADTPYFFVGEADAETDVVNSSVPAVPEPAEVSLVVEGLAILAFISLARRRHAANKAANRGLLMLLGGAMLGLAAPAHAMYIGSDAPDICQTCGAQPTRLPGGTINTSLSEGNIREDYPVVTVKSAYGKTLPFGLSYNSYNADGSKVQLDTGLGFGWTHTYNTLLFQQRGQMFRLGADGRVTQYYMNYSGNGGSYISDTGYFETMTKQPDGSFIVTNKNQSWWHFGPVSNTPFLVAGPVYRLLQMGDPNQNITTMSYNASGLLTSVTDPFGRTLQFTYNASNKLSSVTDPLGRTTTFQYDSQARMPTQITDPMGNTVQYTYNAQYQMTRKVDRDGRMYFYTYKSLRPFMVTDGNGQPWFSLTNPTNWAVNQTNQTYSLRHQYVPSTTTSTDGNGNLWRYSYDINGYITQTIAPDGSTTLYTYDPATLKISSMTDADGNTTTYQYDGSGNRIKMTDALGDVTTYTYDPVFNQMTSMTDPDGRVTTYTYDGHGNQISATDPIGQTQSWTYDANGNILSYTDKDGNSTTYIYDGFGERISMTDPLGNVTSYTYDSIGNVISTTDPLGRTTRYQYDALDRLIGTTNALNGVTSYTYDSLGRQLSLTDPNTNTTIYQYDLRGRVIQTTDALGGHMQYGYDLNNNRIATTNQLGHTTTYTYDAQNRKIGTTNPIGGVTSYTYDPVGNRISSTDPNTNTTLYVYDALNRVASTTNALGGVTMYDYSMPGGPPCCSPTPGSSLLTRKQDADGNITYYHYDELNRLVQVVRKNSDTNDVINPADAVTTTAYDPNNNVIAVTDPNTNTTTYTYNPDNRRISMVNAAGDTTLTSYDGDGNVVSTNAPNNNTTTNVYDALNRIVFIYDEIGVVRSNTYDPDGNVLSTTDGLGHTTAYSYDALNRQTAMTDALGHTSTTAYDADSNVTSTTDRNGHTTTYSYDALDRRVSMTDALANTTVTIYDPDSNVIGMTDANGHTTSYTYDGLNRRITEIYPGALPNTCTNSYDAVGNIISRIDQKGQVTTYSYNDLYYLTNRAYLPSGSNDSFTYDNGGRILGGSRNGWVDTFAYDGADRLTNTVQNGRVLTYTYNIPGRVQTNTQPSGRVLNYTYDARNRLATLNDTTPNPPIVTYVYDDADRVVTRTYRNGTTATYTYNADNWVTSLNHSNGPTLIAGFNYAYDNEGNKLYEQKLDNPTNSAAYAYDAMDRLTSCNIGTLSGSIVPSPTLAKGWSLDPLGNWNTVTSNSVPEVRTYSSANELLTDNGSNYLYDADGNLAQDNSYNYSYDELNRLTQVQRRSDSAIVGQYYYDALGRRVTSVANPAGVSSTNLYFYDRARLVEDQNPGGLTIATYTCGNYVDEALTMDRAGQSYYYHQNALWSPHALTDASGNVVERYTYDAYGGIIVLDASYNSLSLNAWGTPHSAVGNPFLFTGRELDEESGLCFYRARYYDPTKGRFLQRDAKEYVDGMNLYEYAKDNPVRFVDPSGNGVFTYGTAGCTQNLPDLPEGCVVLRGGRELAKWLWCYAHGSRIPVIGTLAASGVNSGCALSSDRIRQIAGQCNGRAKGQAQIDCAVQEVHNALDINENVCRHFGRCFKLVWEEMGGTQTLTGRVVGLGAAGHSFNMIESAGGGTYYVDAFNDILFWCPKQ